MMMMMIMIMIMIMIMMMMIMIMMMVMTMILFVSRFKVFDWLYMYTVFVVSILKIIEGMYEDC